MAVSMNRWTEMNDAEREQNLTWLREAWNALVLDADAARSPTMSETVRTGAREAVNFGINGEGIAASDVQANAEKYRQMYEYGVTHPMATGRIHAAPPIDVAIPNFRTGTPPQA